MSAYRGACRVFREGFHTVDGGTRTRKRSAIALYSWIDIAIFVALVGAVVFIIWVVFG